MKKIILILPFLIFKVSLISAQSLMNIHQNNGSVIQLPLNTIDSITYTINNSANLASISTVSATSITSNSAISGGMITSDGGALITQRGVCFSTAPFPTLANSIVVSGSGTGNFTSALSGLLANTTYYVRAYATNSVGTSYGNEITFTTQNSANLASISTVSATSITSNSAISGGLITSDGGAFVTQRGVCFSTSPFPTTANSIIVSGSGTGSFTSALSGLLANTTYYVRAYATNSVGTAYGIQITFSTTSGIISNPGAGVTFDGYTYSSIVLGNGQEWMSENLRTASYANGDPIQNISNSDQWNMTTGNWPTTGAWAHYNNDSQYENPYGKLYNWYSVSDSRNVCPSGWHVPSYNDWIIFISYLEPSYDINNSDNLAGGKIKSTGTQYWASPNFGATNESGFSGLPGGVRFYDGSFSEINQRGNYWSSTEEPTSPSDAWFFRLGSASPEVQGYANSKETGYSIRCLKN
jgi:uncharacterized protein (TIGR02145 family)